MKKPIYLDNHATTPLDPRVFAAIRPYLEEEFGNAASNTHAYGWRAKAAVEKARASVAKLIGARGDEVIFTSGATESNDWALISTLRPGDHLITTAFEHKSVLCTAEYLQKLGVFVTLLAPNAHGQISVNDLEKAITPKTKLISIMMANNEVGSILPIAQIGQIAKSRSILFHCDAVQAAGKVKIDVDELGVDYLSLSAHKIYGPKGVGATFLRRKIKCDCTPLIFGGGQEQSLRGGTLNVPGIVGFGVACDILLAEDDAENNRIKALRDRLWHSLKDALPDTQLNGAMDNRLPGNLNISFAGVDGEMMLLCVQSEIAVSAGSACSSASRGSHVLTAMGIAPDRIQASFRVGIGRFNTQEEIDHAAKALVLAHAKARC